MKTRFFSLGILAMFFAGNSLFSADPLDAHLNVPKNSTAFSFAVLGDVQGKGLSEKWKKTADWLAERKPAFWIPVGDLVDKGLKPEQWDAFFADGSSLLKASPIIPVIGNHECYFEKAPEQFPSLFYERFPIFRFGKEMPDGWYSFDYSDAHFVVLNNYTFGKDGKIDKSIIGSTEKQWLESDLSKSRARWKFVFMHEPVYSSGPHGGESKLLIKEWVPIFEKYSVDIVFSGHTHAFEVTCRIFEGKKTQDERLGSIYFNCAGVNYSAVPKGSWFTEESQKNEREILVPIVEIDGGKLKLSVWTPGAASPSYSLELRSRSAGTDSK